MLLALHTAIPAELHDSKAQASMPAALLVEVDPSDQASGTSGPQSEHFIQPALQIRCLADQP